MAQKIKLKKGQDFVFTPSKRGGGDSRYDWDNWLNGDLILLEQSTGTKGEKGEIVDVVEKKDFEVNINEMIAKTRSAARRRYKNVQISRYDVEKNHLKTAFIMQASDMTATECGEEDKRRVVEKEKLKAAKLKKAAESNGHGNIDDGDSDEEMNDDDDN